MTRITPGQADILSQHEQPKDSCPPDTFNQEKESLLRPIGRGEVCASWWLACVGLLRIADLVVYMGQPRTAPFVPRPRLPLYSAVVKVCGCVAVRVRVLQGPLPRGQGLDEGVCSRREGYGLTAERRWLSQCPKTVSACLARPAL